MKPKKDIVDRVMFWLAIFFVLLCIAVVGTGCFGAKLYECEIWRVEGIFLTDKLHDRHGMVEVWRYDDAGTRRTFLFHRNRLTDCRLVGNAETD